MRRRRNVTMEMLGGVDETHRGILSRCLLCALAFFILNLFHSTATLGLNLLQARSRIQDAVGAIRSDDFGDARDDLSRAASDAARARAELDDPSLQILRTLAGAERELDAIASLSRAAEGTARSGLRTLPGLHSGAAGVYRDGTLDLDALEDLELRVGETRTSIQRGLNDLETAPEVRFAPLRRTLDGTRRDLIAAEHTLGRSERLLDVLPAILGADGTRRYLLAFQTPSEARGGGGLIGVVSVLEANRGSLRLGSSTTIQEINAGLRGNGPDAPGWFRRTYADLTALDDARQVNLSPSFSATSRILLDMYARSTGERLDGVVAMDPIVLGKMTRSLGRLRGEGWKARIGAGNARRVLLHDLYRRFGRSLGRAQNRYLESLVQAVWRKLRAGDFEVGALGAAIVDSIRTQHLKVFFADPRVDRVLEDLDATSDPTAAGENVQVVFNNNFAGNKIDYFLSRRIDTTITLKKSGEAIVETDISLRNRAPGGPGDLITRPLDKSLPVGLNRMTLHAMLPATAVALDWTVEGKSASYDEGSDAGRPVMWRALSLVPDEAAEVTVRYCLPAGEAVDRDGTLSFTLWPQATVRPDPFSLTVRSSAPIDVTGAGDALRTPEGVRIEGVLKTPRDFVIDTNPAPSATGGSCSQKERSGFRSLGGSA